MMRDGVLINVVQQNVLLAPPAKSKRESKQYITSSFLSWKNTQCLDTETDVCIARAEDEDGESNRKASEGR